MNKENQGPYVLMIDKKRDDILSLMLTIVHTPLLLGSFKKAISAKGLDSCMVDFVKEMSDSSHRRGWCEDPTCTWVDSENKDKK